MSPPGQEPDANRAAEIDAAAAGWLDRQDSGHWGRADRAELDAWLDESPVHRIAYWRMEAAWTRTERLAALRHRPRVRWRGPFITRVAAAAALLILAVGAGYTLYVTQPVGTTYATNIGGHQAVVLPDGSRIELNTDTAVRVALSANKRKVWLEKGEAYFQVVHNAAKPFVVIAGDRRVTDLGTRFVVHRSAHRVEVAVVEGRVSVVGNKPDAHPLVLTGGDEAIATVKGVSLSKKPAKALADELAWRHGLLVFNGTPLVEAARQINRYSTLKILMGSADIGRIPITGTVSATDPEEFVQMAHNVFGLHETKTKDGIVISR